MPHSYGTVLQARAKTALPALYDTCNMHEASTGLLQGMEDGWYTFSVTYFSGSNFTRIMAGGALMVAHRYFQKTFEPEPPPLKFRKVDWDINATKKLISIVLIVGLMRNGGSIDQRFITQGMKNLTMARGLKEVIVHPQIQKMLGKLRVINFVFPSSVVNEIHPAHRNLAERVGRTLPVLLLTQTVGDYTSGREFISPVVLETLVSETEDMCRNETFKTPTLLHPPSRLQRAAALGGGVVGILVSPTLFGGCAGVVAGAAVASMVARLVLNCKYSWDMRTRIALSS